MGISNPGPSTRANARNHRNVFVTDGVVVLGGEAVVVVDPGLWGAFPLFVSPQAFYLRESPPHTPSSPLVDDTTFRRVALLTNLSMTTTPTFMYVRTSDGWMMMTVVLAPTVLLPRV